MQKFFRNFLLIMPFFISHVHGKSIENNYYRNFWNPTYQNQRLSYCTIDKKSCGKTVADRYCQLLGYKRASKQIIGYNAGLTNYLLTRLQCRGWDCHGFMLITCEGKLPPKPIETYYYRLHRYVFPRYDHYRVDWCYQNRYGCGKRAAYSFCRRMGYRRANHFTQEINVGATKALGNHKLCFGNQCNGFSEISCYR